LLEVRVALAALALAMGLAACGGGSGAGGGSESVSKGAQLPSWVKNALGEKAGPDVAATMGSEDFAVGKNRVVFLVVRGNGKLVEAPSATVRVASADGTPRTVKAVLEPLGAEEHAHAEGPEVEGQFDVTEVYVAHVDAPRPGRYWFVVDPAGEEIQAVGTLDVKQHSTTPPVGTPAPASNNPTLADGPAKRITTARPPDKDLLHYSVAGSLRDHAPFVVVFSTPAYCQSRVCGPVTEVVQHVAKHFARSGIRFIHIEIYTDNDPNKGFNRWVREWDLPTEPWVFLVDAAGVIRGKFEGAVSIDELTRAVREDLRTGP
jgi:hypothetical protein